MATSTCPLAAAVLTCTDRPSAQAVLLLLSSHAQIVPPLKLTLEELAQYGGSDPAKPLLLAVCGTVLDVSAGKFTDACASKKKKVRLERGLRGAAKCAASGPVHALACCTDHPWIRPHPKSMRHVVLQVRASTARRAPTRLPARSARAPWPSFRPRLLVSLHSFTVTVGALQCWQRCWQRRLQGL